MWRQKYNVLEVWTNIEPINERLGKQSVTFHKNDIIQKYNMQ